MRFSFTFLAVLAFPTGLIGATLTANCSIAPLTISNGVPSVPDVFRCPQFNPALGTLSSVFVSGGGGAQSGSYTVRNDTAFTITDLHSGYTTQLPIDFPGGLFFVLISPMIGRVDTLAPGETRTFNGTSDRFGVLPSFGSPLPNADLAPYVGTGTVASSFRTISAPPFGDGLTFLSWSTTVNIFRADITYTFDANPQPVPEPAAATLFALAGAGLLGVARRRRGRVQ